MKNIFGIEKNQEGINGKVFEYRRLNPELHEKVNKIQEDKKIIDKLYKTPFLVYFVLYLSFMFLITSFISIINYFSNPNNVDIKRVITIFVISLVAFLGSIFYSRYKKKKATKNELYDDYLIRAEEIEKEVFKDLNIPNDATKFDIILHIYEIKNDKEKSVGIVSYFNLETFLYKDDEYLYFADYSMVLRIPLKSFLRIKRVNKRLQFAGWNKEKRPSDSQYKEYKIVEGNGFLQAKYHYSLELNDNFNDYNIIFLPHELNTINKLLNLEVIEEESK